MYYKHETIWNELLPSLTFSREWHTKEDNEVLCKYAQKIKDGHMLEIGSAEGQSAITLLLATSDIYLEIIEPSVTPNLLTNLRALDLDHRVIIMPTTSQKAFVPPMATKLLFIDGLHTYEGVKHDLERWGRLEGLQYIIIHDITNPDVDKAVNEFVLKGTFEVEFVGDNIKVLYKINKDLR